MAFKLEIVDINRNADNILLTDDLTVEDLKIKYNWILNASVKNCIIGKDSYGIVWYCGEWVCGEWEDGTWLSGIWHDGIWKNGRWYSYLIDKNMALSKRFPILENDKKYSEFRSGTWKNGEFNNGIFGYERDINNKVLSDITSRNFISSYWETGKFYNGLFKNSVWFNGYFYKGDIVNSYWIYGDFHNGTFDNYEWRDGVWRGGDFIQGRWYNGIFDQVEPSIRSRFGTGDKSIWYNGIFSTGEPSHQPEFHSGLNVDASGNTLPSVNSKNSTWISGNFKGGKWYGGHFKSGNFQNGYWYGGVFGNLTGSTNYSKSIWISGFWYNGLWINGTFKNGHFYNGMWLDGQIENGYISTNINDNDLTPTTLSEVSYAPSVQTIGSSSTSDRSIFLCSGKVSNDGGNKISDRGFCYTSLSSVTPNIYECRTITDGGGLGSVNLKLSNLYPNTTYYYRAFAKNFSLSYPLKDQVGYGDVMSFTTSGWTLNEIPVNTEVTQDIEITNSSAILHGSIESNIYSIGSYGFYLTGYTSVPTYEKIEVGTSIAPPDTFFTGLTNLSASTYYDYMAYANQVIPLVGGTGSTLTFRTKDSVTATIPVVETVYVETVSGLTVTAYGRVINNGNLALTEVGFQSGSTINGTFTPISPSAIISTYFSQNLTMSKTGTTYYIKAYAKNSEGDGLGDPIMITSMRPPDVQMVSLSNSIMDNKNAFTSKGLISLYGYGYPPLTGITEVGFLLRKVSGTTVSGPSFETVDPLLYPDNTVQWIVDLNKLDASGYFTDTFSGITGYSLESNAIYYVRSYARNLYDVGLSPISGLTMKTIGINIKPTIDILLLEENYEIGVGYVINPTVKVTKNDEITFGNAELKVTYPDNIASSSVQITSWSGFRQETIGTYIYYPIKENESDRTLKFIASQSCGINNYYEISGLTIANSYYPFLWTLTSSSKENDEDYFYGPDPQRESTIGMTNWFYKDASYLSGGLNLIYFGGKVIDGPLRNSGVSFNMYAFDSNSRYLSFGYPSSYDKYYNVFYSFDTTNWVQILTGITATNKTVYTREQGKNNVNNFSNPWYESYTILHHDFDPNVSPPEGGYTQKSFYIKFEPII